MTTDRVLLVDGDILVYRAAFSAQQTLDFGDEDPVVSTDKGVAEASVHEAIETWQSDTKCNKVVIALSDSMRNFRQGLYPDYKGNRDPRARPELYSFARGVLESEYTCEVWPALEGDDVLGILSTHPTLIKGKKCILSGDKDMQTIPGWLWNPHKDDKPWKVSEAHANRFHLMQTMSGDAVDNYPGAPGTGQGRAEELLDGELKYVRHEREITRGVNKGQIRVKWLKEAAKSPWDTVVSAFEKAGLTEKDALLQARLARILRAEDYDYENREVKLWNP